MLILFSLLLQVVDTIQAFQKITEQINILLVNTLLLIFMKLAMVSRELQTKMGR